MAPFRIFIVGDWEGGVPTACILCPHRLHIDDVDVVTPVARLGEPMPLHDTTGMAHVWIL